MNRVVATRALAVVAAGMLLTVGLQACSSDSKSPVALTVTASESGDQMKFDVPATIDGGVVKITFKNTGKQPHELQLVRVKDGTTPDQFVKDVVGSEGSPIPDYVLGPAGGAGPTAPGATTVVTQKLDPGTYVYFCSMGDGDAVHYKHGMLGTVTVKGDKGKGDLPKATATVSAHEYGFDISGLKAGANTVLWQNTGKELHMALFLPMAPGATLDQVKAALSAPPDQQSGPPPVDFSKATGLEVLAPGDKLVQESLTLEKGSYAVVCFVNDKAGGPPHVDKGMIQQLDVS